MAIKFPLIMKNDVKVSSLSELKENFDIELIVGYYMDGKLNKWLEARYYEEELEQLESIDKDDPNLIEKICGIFEVEYKDQNINTEEIEKRNKRMQMIKQITDDEEVVKNIENVAFNQEELANLYDNNVNIIYLFKGEFSIPKSKIHLEYKEYGNPKITWPKEKLNDKNNDAIYSTTEKNKKVDIIYDTIEKKGISSDSYEISQRLADKIKIGKYVLTDTYVVYTSGGLLFNELTFFNKNYCSSKTVKFDEIPMLAKKEIYALYGDKVLIVYYQLLGLMYGPKKFIVYDINSNRRETLEIECAKNILVNKNRLFYNDNYISIMYDFDTKKNITLPKIDGAYAAKDNVVYYEKNNSIMEYELGSKERKTIYNLNVNRLSTKIFCINDILYIFQESLSNHSLIALDTQNVNNETEIFNFTATEEYKIKISEKYIVYSNMQKDYPIYVYNTKTKILRMVAWEFRNFLNFGWINSYDNESFINDFYIVGDYLYYKKGKEESFTCINIETGEYRKLN